MLKIYAPSAIISLSITKYSKIFRLLQKRHMEQQQRDEHKREFFESTSAEEFQHSPDDETFWAEYCQRDFQTVYESAHREDVENWDKQKLIEAVSYTHLTLPTILRV